MAEEIKHIINLDELKDTLFMYNGKEYKINLVELEKLFTERVLRRR